MRNVNATVKDLIEQLRQLNLLEEDILSRLAAIDAEEETPREIPVVIPRAVAVDSPQQDIRYSPGDRVRITNKFRKPFGWNNRTPWDENSGRNAVVTSVSGNKVYITTDNGIRTWRLSKNLISQQAYENRDV